MPVTRRPLGEIRLDVPTAEALARLLAEPLPEGLKPRSLRREAFRDVFYDTPDGELRKRGIVCRIRHTTGDRRLLALRWATGAGSAPGEEFEAYVTPADALAILSGNTAPARRLRGFVNPERLVEQVELVTDRQLRSASAGLLPLVAVTFAYDQVTARAGELVTEYRQLAIQKWRKGGPDLEQLAALVAERHNLRVVLSDPVERAVALLQAVEAKRLVQEVQEHREVTVIAVEGGRIALARGQDDLRLPFVSGTGEDTCRNVMRQALGNPEGQVVRMGVVPATATRPAIEVWLARRLHRTLPHDGSIQWFAPGEIVARVGSPILRDPKTLAALALAARSELLPEWSQMTGEGWRGNVELPTDEYAVSSRRTLTLLQVPILREEALDVEKPAPEQFVNAELSWLAFNTRVLELAEDPGVPLLARVRFLSIFSTNLDEFFQVKVAGLKQAVAARIEERSPDGLTPAEQLDAIAIRLRGLIDRAYACFQELSARSLPEHGIRIRRWDELDEATQGFLRTYFDEQVFPVITPRAITRAPGHPFPMIEDLTISLAVAVLDPRGGREHLAQIRVPDSLPRFVRLPESHDFVPIEEVIRPLCGVLYPGRTVRAVEPFRVVRAGDIDLDEQHASSLAQAIEEQVRRRPIAPVVRLDVHAGMPRAMRETLLRELQYEEAEHHAVFSEADVYEVSDMVDLGALAEIANCGVEQLDYTPFRGVPPFDPDRSIFEQLDEGDRLVHYPYDSFSDSMERFVVEAADDPDVAAIRITLYRPGGPSAMGEALSRAAAAGKEVSVFVELKARFDEQRNIYWAKQLERAGIHVVTGLVEYKTHAKIALVVRRRDGKLKRYAQISSGNYNANSARLYTDLGLFTTHPEITEDVQRLFNELTGSTRPPTAEFRRLLVAPTNMRQRFLELIAREAEHARAGRPAHIRAKMNALGDPEVIAALYRASQAGVDIDLVVRGFCTLRPGVPMLSERIRVVSILGRFLEHARIFAFANGGDPEYYMGSADWRPRNLKRRVEVVTPILDPACRERVEHILESEINDPLAWEMGSDGTYTRLVPPTGVEPVTAQERFMREARERVAEAGIER